jgi:hypothetical protein
MPRCFAFGIEATSREGNKYGIKREIRERKILA